MQPVTDVQPEHVATPMEGLQEEALAGENWGLGATTPPGVLLSEHTVTLYAYIDWKRESV